MPRTPDKKSPCPKCGEGYVFHTIRNQGDRWKITGKILGNQWSMPRDGEEVCKLPFVDHQCRACSHRWATKVQGRDEKWRTGYKTPVEGFTLPVILPHHVCVCGADYGLVLRNRGFIAKFCPYCGIEAKPQPTDWLETLRKEQPETGE